MLLPLSLTQTLMLLSDVAGGAGAVIDVAVVTVVTVSVSVAVVIVTVVVVVAVVCRPVGSDAPCQWQEWLVPRGLETSLAPPLAVPAATSY